MPYKQQLFALLVSFAVFVFTIEMVRKKRLREEYSVLWLATSITMFTLIVKYDWLMAVTNLIGAVLPTTTLFLGSIIFLMLLCVQFSIKISRLSDQVKDLVQDNALLRHEFEALARERGPGAGGRHCSETESGG
ncbi:MAG TPA: DUF2304 domain-containing protein [Geobacteraceae bacterium]